VADVFRHEFTMVRTGHTVRLDITPAGATILAGSPTIDMLDGGVIKLMGDWGWEHYRKIPYGMPSAVTGRLVIDCNRAPSDLVDWLTDGIQSVTTEIHAGGLRDYTVTYDTGTTFMLYIKPAGGAQFTLVGSYVQDVTQEVIPDPATDELEVNVVDALHHALKVLTFSGETVDGVANDGLLQADWDFYANGGASVLRTTAVVEWVWKGGLKWYYIAHIPPGSEIDNDAASCYWSVNLPQITVVWNSYVQAIYQAIMRRFLSVDISTALDNAFDNLYKQNYTTNALAGAALSVGVMKWILFATNNNDVSLSTSRDASLHDLLAKAYDNLWDFLYDIPRSRFKVWHLSHYADARMLAYNPFEYPESMTEMTIDIRESQIKMRSSVVARVESQTEFKLGEDYDHQLARAPVSRNQTTIDEPVIFDSVPVIDTYMLASGLKSGYFTDRDTYVRDRLQNTDPANGSTVDVQGDDGENIGNPRLLGCYYSDNPTDGTIGDAFHTTALIRAYAWQGFIADGETPTPPATTGVVLSSTPGIVNGEANAIATQQEMGGVYQLAHKIKDTYYGHNTTTIDTDVHMDTGAVLDLTGTESQWLPFTPVIRPFEVAMTDYKSYLAACPNVFHATSCYLDFQTELMSISLWGK
jgi:hypothetical protein